jgi:putative hydrolase of the HAD superfamily
MSINTILFDLDDTLYPSSNGLWNAIRNRMMRYMWEILDLPRDEVPSIRRTYFETYGTTLRGLQIHYGVDPDDYLAYVHDLPLKEYLSYDPELRRMLMSLPQHKWIFTNADDAHARRVLDVLGVTDCFEGIIDVRAFQFACKPEREAYERAQSLIGLDDPSTCLVIDDSDRNLITARDMGFYTVLVGDDQPHETVCASILDIHNLKSALPELWDGFLST